MASIRSGAYGVEMSQRQKHLLTPFIRRIDSGNPDLISGDSAYIEAFNMALRNEIHPILSGENLDILRICAVNSYNLNGQRLQYKKVIDLLDQLAPYQEQGHLWTDLFTSKTVESLYLKTPDAEQRHPLNPILPKIEKVTMENGLRNLKARIAAQRTAKNKPRELE